MDLVVAAASFASLLLAARVLARDDVGSHAQAHLLSVLVLSGAGALSPDITFLFCFVPFVFALAWALLLAEVAREAGPASRRLPLREVVGPRLAWGVTAWTLAALAATAVLFVIFPRTPLSLGLRRPLSGSTVGLSDEVVLAGFGTLKRDDRVVLRVRAAWGAPRSDLSGRYWRAHVLTEYDGRRWRPGPRRVLATSDGGLRLGPRIPVREALEVEVVADLPGTVLPLPGRAVQVEPVGRDARGRHLRLRLVSRGEVHAAGDPAEPWRYRVGLAPAGGWRDRAQPGPADLALPPQDPRVTALAERFERAAGGKEALPAYLEGALASRYHYTLELPGADPSLETFLFERREGHCEYFATAMAVLLRARGIPARIVTGFYGGARNEEGGYWVLRQGDAHAWVEAYRPGVGWQRYDPTPPEGRGRSRGRSLRERLADLWDATQERWSNLVLDYNLRAQLGLWREAQPAARHRFRAGGKDYLRLEFRFVSIGTLDGGEVRIRVPEGWAENLCRDKEPAMPLEQAMRFRGGAARVFPHARLHLDAGGGAR